MNANNAVNGLTTPQAAEQPKEPPQLMRKKRVRDAVLTKDLMLVAEKLKRYKKAQEDADSSEKADALRDVTDLTVMALAMAP